LATLWRLIVTPFSAGTGVRGPPPGEALLVVFLGLAMPDGGWAADGPETPCVVHHISNAKVMSSQHETRRTRPVAPRAGP
jgi:hypothetical protein